MTSMHDSPIDTCFNDYWAYFVYNMDSFLLILLCFSLLSILSFQLSDFCKCRIKERVILHEILFDARFAFSFRSRSFEIILTKYIIKLFISTERMKRSSNQGMPLIIISIQCLSELTTNIIG